MTTVGPRRRAVVAVATAVVLAACTGAREAGPELATVTATAASSPSSSPSPTPSPSPSPTPTRPAPVVGTVEVATLLASARERNLGLPDEPPLDDARARDAARRVAAALDAHLTATQVGEADLVALGAGWARRDRAARRSLTTALGTADNPVTGASYAITVQWEGAPTLAVTNATVTREDGTTATVELVFDVGARRPALLLVGPPAAGGGA